MKITEMQPYIMGKKFMGESKPPVKLSHEYFDKVFNFINNSNTAKINIQLHKNYKDFYESEPDVLNVVEKGTEEEIFFACKNGMIVEGVPARCVFLVREAYSKYSIPNLITTLIPPKDLTLMFSKGYFADGITLCDVIRNLCCSNYMPMGDTVIKAKLDDKFSEVYIMSTDMIAVLPNEIIADMTNRDISDIVVTRDGLVLHNKILRSLKGYYGATTSIYDLRDLK